ncbi:MAG: hypothetical protein KDD73_13615 [Anaerolineales bacterium]|nr:hypothetical protein [Anaerolineales bacterium]MCB9127556.1 molybdopterin-binding protein [Ardenticatenales bacterium]
MEIRTLPLDEAHGHILLHNVADEVGRKRVKKGVPLSEKELTFLRDLGHQQVEVAVLDADDLREDEAAQRIAAALIGTEARWRATRAVAGRINLHCDGPAVLYLDEERLRQLNALRGVTLATRAAHTPLGTALATTQAATLKVIPYALPRPIVEEAAQRAVGLLRLRPLRQQRVALLLAAEVATADKLLRQFAAPMEMRLQRYGSALAATESVAPAVAAIAEAAARLLATHDALIVAGQTSIMDIDDRPLRALRQIGVQIALHGAPVEPGNLLALGYRGDQWIMGAPGCARSPAHNVVDLVLPRLLAGEQLGAAEVAALGLGGLL